MKTKTIPLPGSFIGTCLLLLWLAAACSAQTPASPPLTTTAAAVSNKGSLSLRVVDPQGAPAPGALVYLGNRELAPVVTDQQGLVHLDPTSEVVQPVALALLETRSAGQEGVCCYNGQASPCGPSQGYWSYRIYLTNLTWSSDGSPQAATRQQDGMVELQLQHKHPLVLFDLVVSLDWIASNEYLAGVEKALRSASDYLFDLADGQMALGRLEVYSNGQQWSEADIRIHRENTICPYATIGVLTGLASEGRVELGPSWDGDFVSGEWSNRNGFRTIVHEFMHYAFGLYDEYIDEAGQPADCTKPKDQLPPAGQDQLSASAMFHEELATELSAHGDDQLWSEDCKNTRQWQRTGRSAWEAVELAYGDSCQKSPRWQIETPQDRGEPMAGPDPELGQWPPALPRWPEVIVQGRRGPSARDLPVRFSAECNSPTASITLYPGGRYPSKPLGEAPLHGEYVLLGAQIGDVICATTKDEQNRCASAYKITSSSFGETPTIDLSDPACDLPDPELPVALSQLGLNWGPAWPLWQVPAQDSYEPGKINVAVIAAEGVSSALSYSQASGAPGMAALLQETLLQGKLPGGPGYGQILATDSEADAFAQTDQHLIGTYAMQQFEPGETSELFSADGRVGFSVTPSSLPQEGLAATILQLTSPPSTPLPSNVRLMNDITYIAKVPQTETEADARAEHNAVLESRCIPRPVIVGDPVDAASRRTSLLWLNEATGKWEEQHAEFVDAANILTAQISRPGYYAFVEIVE